MTSLFLDCALWFPKYFLTDDLTPNGMDVSTPTRTFLDKHSTVLSVNLLFLVIFLTFSFLKLTLL